MAEANLNLVVIRSTDLERTARFYEALGVVLFRERHGAGPEHLAGPAGLAILEIYPQSGGASTSTVRLGFRVGSLTDVLRVLPSAGGTVISPPRDSPWGLRAVVSDPDGHQVELVE